MTSLLQNTTAANRNATQSRTTIFGFSYQITPIRVAAECGTVAFELLKISSQNHYHVIRDNHGEVSCDCPDFEMRKIGTGKPCKHGAKLIELGLIAPSTPNGSTRHNTLGGHNASPIVASRPATTPTTSYPSRPRRFVPSVQDEADYARMMADDRSAREQAVRDFNSHLEERYERSRQLDRACRAPMF
jgi:SWIM zinc finger